MSKKLIAIFSLFTVCLMSGRAVSMDFTQVTNSEVTQRENVNSSFAGKIEYIHKTKNGLLYVFYENKGHKEFSYSIIDPNNHERIDFNHWIPGSLFNVKLSQADISKFITSGPNDELYIPVLTSSSVAGKYSLMVYKLTPEMSATAISEVYQKNGELQIRGLKTLAFNSDFSKLFMGVKTDRENLIISAFDLNKTVEKPEDAQLWRKNFTKVKLTHATYDVRNDALVTTLESPANSDEPSFNVYTLDSDYGNSIIDAKMNDLGNELIKGRLLSVEPEKNDDAVDSRYVFLDNCKLGLWHRYSGNDSYNMTGSWKDAPNCNGTSVWKLSFNKSDNGRFFINYPNAVYAHNRFDLSGSEDDAPIFTIYPPENAIFQSDITFDDKGNGYLNYWDNETKKGGFVKFNSSGENESVTVQNMTAESAKIAPVMINGTVYNASDNNLYEYKEKEGKIDAVISGGDKIIGQTGLLLSAEKSMLPDGPINSETLFSWSALGDNAGKVNFSSSNGTSTFLRATDGTLPFDVKIKLTVIDGNTGQEGSAEKIISYHPATDSEGDMKISILGDDRLVRAGTWSPVLPEGTRLDDVNIEWMVDDIHVDRASGIDLDNGISGWVSGRPLELSLTAPRNLTDPDLILKVIVTDKKNGKQSTAEKIITVGK